jgi:hypothetical protein
VSTAIGQVAVDGLDDDELGRGGGPYSPARHGSSRTPGHSRGPSRPGLVSVSRSSSLLSCELPWQEGTAEWAKRRLNSKKLYSELIGASEDESRSFLTPPQALTQPKHDSNEAWEQCCMH